MEMLSSRAVRATSSLSVPRHCSRSTSAAAVAPQLSRPSCLLHTSATRDATPLPHPTVAGPPPQAPHASVSFPQDRLARKRQQAEQFIQSQKAKVNPDKPTSALQKRFWKNVSIQESEDGLQVMLDARPVRTAGRQILNLPHHRRGLAMSIAMEWDQLVSAQQALKQHYIPLTSMTSRAMDIANEDKDGNSEARDSIVRMAMRYLGTDTLLCWAPERNIHDPYQKEGEKPLRDRQRDVAEPIIAFLKTHIFPGVDIEPILDESSIVPRSQPEMTRNVIRGWITGLPAFELAALERGVLATKSLLVAARLLVEWSQEYRHLHHEKPMGQRFGINEANEAATLEVMHQIENWGEVEDSHDVEREDMRRQLGSVVLLVS
ncbi:hypothetical protein KC340_g13757 [Hortaea werneckii]|nr:hypothetical protein KC342_g18546 [Hortaea werneckii]KAI7068465.1 hypothetical protein KC339_g15067 [Hortaea werneckii]KAI7223010.1 hypothetical protein KC365_g11246 [Hortaea werneckii]KAI7299519.1 hypothetical protein KC340_g13757 [Hortaea werneckii]KAI7380165.1 hypothetical protein KC328_g12931 [Hortaea werneckii]